MTTQVTQPGLQFLSVAEAAETLGVSRLKIREAAAKGMLPARWDNEKRLRVDLTGITAEQIETSKKSVSQSALMDLLFDEVEELHEALLSRDAETDALKGLAERQAAALDDAADRMERDAAEKARLSELLARAMAHLEREPAVQGDDRLTDIPERALQHLETTGDRLESALAHSGRMDQLLDRALQAGERLEGKLAVQEQEIKAQGQALDKALAMSERAVALANTAPPRKRSFWHWLRGQ